MFVLLVCIKSETLSSFQHFTSWIWSMHFLQQEQRHNTMLTLPTSTTATWQSISVGIKDNTQKVSPCHVALSNLKRRREEYKERRISCWLRRPNYNGILLSFYFCGLSINNNMNWHEQSNHIPATWLSSKPPKVLFFISYYWLGSAGGGRLISCVGKNIVFLSHTIFTNRKKTITTIQKESAKSPLALVSL